MSDPAATPDPDPAATLGLIRRAAVGETEDGRYFHDADHDASFATEPEAWADYVRHHAAWAAEKDRRAAGRPAPPPPTVSVPATMGETTVRPVYPIEPEDDRAEPPGPPAGPIRREFRDISGHLCEVRVYLRRSGQYVAVIDDGRRDAVPIMLGPLPRLIAALVAVHAEAVRAGLIEPDRSPEAARAALEAARALVGPIKQADVPWGVQGAAWTATDTIARMLIWLDEAAPAGGHDA